MCSSSDRSFRVQDQRCTFSESCGYALFVGDHCPQTFYSLHAFEGNIRAPCCTQDKQPDEYPAKVVIGGGLTRSKEPPDRQRQHSNADQWYDNMLEPVELRTLKLPEVEWQRNVCQQVNQNHWNGANSCFIGKDIVGAQPDTRKHDESQREKDIGEHRHIRDRDSPPGDARKEG